MSVICLGIVGLQKVTCLADGSNIHAVAGSRAIWKSEVGGCPADHRKACWEWSR